LRPPVLLLSEATPKQAERIEGRGLRHAGALEYRGVFHKPSDGRRNVLPHPGNLRL
jgi:hypothetical protein